MPIPTYQSNQRKQALQLCGWYFDTQKNGSGESLETVCNALVREREFERAATLALFYLDIRRAIKCLTASDGLFCSILNNEEDLRYSCQMTRFGS